MARIDTLQTPRGSVAADVTNGTTQARYQG
jgi:hypothetical protein